MTSGNVRGEVYTIGSIGYNNLRKGTKSSLINWSALDAEGYKHPGTQILYYPISSGHLPTASIIHPQATIAEGTTAPPQLTPDMINKGAGTLKQTNQSGLYTFTESNPDQRIPPTISGDIPLPVPDWVGQYKYGTYFLIAGGIFVSILFFILIRGVFFG